MRLTVSYDGRRYRGFEVQPDQRTVRGEIENAIRKVTAEQVRLHAGGRTDAGVHALGQCVSFFTRCPLPPSTLRLRLADELPDDIAVPKLEIVGKEFHARHTAIGRRYRYQILTEKLPLLRGQAYWVKSRLDIDLMEQVLAPLEGRHDFEAFGDVGPHDDTDITMQEVGVDRQLPLVAIELLADRFLWKMVRRIVGAAIAIGRGELPAETLNEALRDPRGEAARKAREFTAPPHGLILVRVVYPGDIKPQAAKLFPMRQ